MELTIFLCLGLMAYLIRSTTQQWLNTTTLAKETDREPKVALIFSSLRANLHRHSQVSHSPIDQGNSVDCPGLLFAHTGSLLSLTFSCTTLLEGEASKCIRYRIAFHNERFTLLWTAPALHFKEMGRHTCFQVWYPTSRQEKPAVSEIEDAFGSQEPLTCFTKSNRRLILRHFPQHEHLFPITNSKSVTNKFFPMQVLFKPSV